MRTPFPYPLFTLITLCFLHRMFIIHYLIKGETKVKKHIRLFISLAFTTILLLTACSETAPSNTGVVPDSSQAIEEAAEDIIDYVPSGNWDKVNTDVQAMANAWQEYQAESGNAEVSQELKDAMTSALGQLQTVSQAKDASGTLQASNDVTAAAINLFSLYDPQIPADIGRLDVLERQVILDVAAQDHDAAMITFNTLRTIWEKVKPSVTEHNGEDVIAQFEASLAIQKSALDAKDDAALTNEAKLALELVDELEKVFR